VILAPVLPLLLSLFFGVICFAFRQSKALRALSLFGALSVMVVQGYLAFEVFSSRPISFALGNWKLPFGIGFFVDPLAVIMGLISSLMVVAAFIFSFGFWPPQDKAKSSQTAFYVLTHFLMIGVYGSFFTGDLFNLYVWFEVLLISSFALLGLDPSGRSQSATLKYAVLNLVGSAFFLLGLGLIYNASGTLNWQDLQALETLSPQITWAAFLLFFAFLMKSAVFPLYSWLPTSYPSLPAPSLALFAGLLTKVGVYTLIRFFGTGFPGAEKMTFSLLALGGLTMILGVWGAAIQKNTKSILSFHIVSQIGYMIVALGTGTALGLTACIFYLIHHMVVKTNLFFIAGYLEKKYGHTDLEYLGEGRHHLLLGFLFAISALSLAGYPPLSGFWAKLIVLESLVAHQAYFWAGLSLFVGTLTFYSMSKIWFEAFQKKKAHHTAVPSLSSSQSFTMLLPIVLLSIWTLGMGLFPSAFLPFAEQAVRILIDQAGGLP
jgi:multicomponent Na+:H+ antiporter subunit D